MDDLIYFGDAVKALDDKGKVGGYLIRFSDAAHKDLDGDYFVSEGYYGPKDGDGAECLFDHGYPVPADRYNKSLKEDEIKAITELADRTFTPIKTKRDAVGIFAETVLNLEDEYEQFIHSRVKLGKIGWSSGAPAHRVRREKDGKITKWVIAEGSLTPRPAEPLNRLVPMKSLGSIKFLSMGDGEPEPEPEAPFKQTALATRIKQHITDLDDSGRDASQIVETMAQESGLEVKQVQDILSGAASRPSDAKLKAFARVLDVSFDGLKEAAERDGANSIKGMFEARLEGADPSPLQIFDTYSGVMKAIADAVKSSAVLGQPFDYEAKAAEAGEELSRYMTAQSIKQVADYVASEDADKEFYLKAIINPQQDPLSTESVDLENHTRLVESASTGLGRRYRKFLDTRVKAGRRFSQRTIDFLSAYIAGQEDHIGKLRELLAEAQPMADDTEKRAAQTAFLRIQSRNSQLGVTSNETSTAIAD
jgi:transcriptional regulator with XRE-family HTH domain